METFKQQSKCLNIFLMFFVLVLLQMNIMYSQTGWFQLPTGTTSDLNSVHFENPLTGWAIGVNCILKTTDGGSRWVQQLTFGGLNDDYIFNSACFSSTQMGCLVGEHIYWGNQHYMVIFRTTDGGANWIRQHTDSGSGLKSVCFPASVSGWSVGSDVILSTTNGGSNWKQQEFAWGLNDDFTYNSVCFMNSLTGWVLADVFVTPPGAHFNAVLTTTNGGTNWIQECRLPDMGLKSIHFQGINTGWAVGGGTIMATTNGSNWTVQLQLGSENCYYFLESIHFINPSTGWVTGGSYCSPFGGYSRVILKTTNGGINWQQQTIAAGSGNFHLNSVFFTNELTGWAVGDGGIILKTTDGGVIGITPVSTEIPAEFQLYQNYPNPFNPSTKIKFEIPNSKLETNSKTEMRIYDALGSEIVTLVNEQLLPGVYEVEWNASNYPSGVYLYKLTVGDFTDVKKMILVK